jgi:hypothetical protein
LAAGALALRFTLGAFAGDNPRPRSRGIGTGKIGVATMTAKINSGNGCVASIVCKFTALTGKPADAIVAIFNRKNGFLGG